MQAQQTAYKLQFELATLARMASIASQEVSLAMIEDTQLGAINILDGAIIGFEHLLAHAERCRDMLIALKTEML